MKQVCDICQHLYSGPVCETCFPTELDAKNAIINELQVKLEVATEALTWAHQMFEARDVMNAKVHCAPVRLSPITERVEAALKLLRGDQ